MCLLILELSQDENKKHGAQAKSIIHSLYIFFDEFMYVISMLLIYMCETNVYLSTILFRLFYFKNMEITKCRWVCSTRRDPGDPFLVWHRGAVYQGLSQGEEKGGEDKEEQAAHKHRDLYRFGPPGWRNTLLLFLFLI